MNKFIRRIVVLIHLYRNKLYWKTYYRNNRKPAKQSSFAEFCLNNYISANSELLELGCGNGRDAIYFSKNNIKVVALDLCKEELSFLEKQNYNNNLTFKATDFTKYKSKELFDVVYSRFTMHTISYEQELLTIKNSFYNLKTGGLFLIEARSDKDELYQQSKKLSNTEGITDHYRRFINFEKILKNLEISGFNIIFSTEQQNLAKYKNENPYIIRIVAQKGR